MCKFCPELPQIKRDELLIMYLAGENKFKVMIQLELDVAADVIREWQEIEIVRRTELKSFYEMRTFKQVLHADARGYKNSDGRRTVKARLTIRGFKDLAEDLDTYTGSGQRLIMSGACRRGWPICMADVSTACLQGLTFQASGVLTNTEPREVSITPQRCAERFFQVLPGMQDYDPYKEVFKIPKCLCSFGGAPKAWRIKLERPLGAAGGRPHHTDHSCWVWF